MIGKSLTVRDNAVDMRRSRTSGRKSAKASVRQSRMIWVSSLRLCANIRPNWFPLIFSGRDLALLTGFFDDADEHVFHGEAPFPHLDHTDSVRLQLFPRGLLAGLSILIGDDMEPVTKQ